MKYNYLFLDIDGVLLNRETDTSEDCWRLLSGLKDKGVSVSFITSRPYGLTKHLSDKIKGYEVGIYDNGGYVAGHEENELISENVVTISPKLLQLLSKELDLNPYFMIGISCHNIFYCNQIYYDYLGTYMTNHGYTKNTNDNMLRRLETKNINSVWIKNSSKRFVDEVTKLTLLNIKISLNKDSIFIHPSASVKENGLLSLALNKNIDLNKTIFIGDTDSDIGVAKLVSLSACPMNATDNIKKIANFVSEKYFSDSIIDVIVSYM